MLGSLFKSTLQNTLRPLRQPEFDATRLGSAAIALPARHEVLSTPLAGPYADGLEVLDLGLGCFWGAERIFWRLPGVVTTMVGYAGGVTPNPSYEEVCSGRTGHTEVVRVVYDPKVVSTETMLRTFFEQHDPTQGMRQGNDVGTQYRSAIYWTTEEQRAAVDATAAAFGEELRRHNLPPVVTEMRPASEAGTFWYAEDYHQQYLHKNPGGYCNHGPYGCSLPPRD